MSTNEPVWPDHLFTDLDRTGPVPLYHQLSSRLERAIREGTIAPGARLANEIAIVERLRLSRPTVRRAIQELVDKGLLVRRRGIGTQVVQGQVTRPVELTSLYDDLRDTHHEPGTRVLEFGVRPASDTVTKALGLLPDSEILHIRRRRSADGVPVAILENHLPAEFAEISPTQLERQGLYQLLRSRGITIRVANQKIGARAAAVEEATLLEIDAGSPLLTMERVTFDDAGHAIEYGDHCYRPDRYSFETTLVAK
jgi:DNA-binding GntR family transcriptional regulator